MLLYSILCHEIVSRFRLLFKLFFIGVDFYVNYWTFIDDSELQLLVRLILIRILTNVTFVVIFVSIPAIASIILIVSHCTVIVATDPGFRFLELQLCL